MTTSTIIAIILGATTLLFLILYLTARSRNGLLQQQINDQAEAHQREMVVRGTMEEQLGKQIAAMEDRFSVLSETITKQRAEELTATTSTTLTSIVQPLRESIREVRQTLSDSSEKETDRTARLEETIRQLTRQSQEVGLKADSLADALRRKPKVQGSWGETQLEVLLEREGFEKGKHYDTQLSLRSDTNALLRPDFVLHFPDERDIIVDAKVSLTAFVDYVEAVEAKDGARQSEALNRHLESLRSHVRELRDKKYQRQIPQPRQALEYVLMFVPNVAALQLAYENDQSLWDFAHKSNVLLTSESTLFALLRLIDLTWRQDAQVKNFAELTKQATLFIERMDLFVKRFEGIQDKMNTLQRAYNETDTALRGRQGVLGTAGRISALSTSSTPLEEEEEE